MARARFRLHDSYHTGGASPCPSQELLLVAKAIAPAKFCRAPIPIMIKHRSGVPLRLTLESRCAKLGRPDFWGIASLGAGLPAADSSWDGPVCSLSPWRSRQLRARRVRGQFPEWKRMAAFSFASHSGGGGFAILQVINFASLFNEVCPVLDDAD